MELVLNTGKTRTLDYLPNGVVTTHEVSLNGVVVGKLCEVTSDTDRFVDVCTPKGRVKYKGGLPVRYNTIEEALSHFNK